MDPARLVAALAYKPGWRFKIGGPLGRYLCVYALTVNSVQQTTERLTQHMFEMPSFDDDHDFYRWVRDRLFQIEQHETCEFLAVAGHRPFYPHHNGDGSPYELVERWET